MFWPAADGEEEHLDRSGGGSDRRHVGVREAADQTIRREIEGFAHVIFAGRPAQREFRLGQRNIGPDAIRARYGGLKPCLYGSDAHKLDDVISEVQFFNAPWMKTPRLFLSTLGW